MVAAAFVCRVLTVGHFQTNDEVLWMVRSETFSDALANLDPASASVTGAKNLFGGPVATMPGVPTMWLGSIARVFWGAGRSLGFWSNDGPFYYSGTGLAAAQLSVAVATSLLIGLVVYLMRRWSTPRAALVTGALLATEPFWVAHGSVIHTDELTALFGLAGLLALVLVLGVPQVAQASLHRTGLALAAGALLACSPLTKISGVAFAPGAAAVVVWAAVGAIRSRPEDASLSETLRPIGRVVGIVAGASVATVLVLWPAIWADPLTQVEALGDSIQLGYKPTELYFRGEIGFKESPQFYFVALPFRMTPWMLVALLVGVPLALARRSTRGRAMVILLATVPIAYTLGTAVQRDRYGLVLLGPLCVVIGLAFVPAVSERRLTATRARTAILVAGLLATIHAAVVAPWGLAYFNPVLGGGEVAANWVPIGWQEGQSLVSRRIAELQRHRCDGVTVYGLNPYLQGTLRCGKWTGDPKAATYVVLYIQSTQRLKPEVVAERTEGRRLVATLKIRGIEYATTWR